MAFEFTWTIYAGDTDYSERICTPVVVDYVVRTLQEFRSSIGFTNKRFQHEAYIPPARNVDIDYLAPIWADDELTITLDPSIGTTSMTYELTGTTERSHAVEGSLTTVFVDSNSGEPIPIPEEFRDNVESFLSE
ncbi:acyl-CoA thioesterase [Haladaptatus sp. DFWS20]|uniref:acyl-CoA thioesterase n=1 Tax=Haladaptatus sp. DFWS20 TaxID=3403467 RepID=UPI003EB8F674